MFFGLCTHQCLNKNPFRKGSHVVDHHKVELLLSHIVKKNLILNPSKYLSQQPTLLPYVLVVVSMYLYGGIDISNGT